MTRPLIRTGRITRELHDEAGQLLTSLLVHLAHIHQDEHDDQHQAQHVEVSNRVNLVKNDDPECAEPVVRLSTANA